MAKQTQQWYDTKRGAAITGIVSLVLAYFIGSRGIDTGSWWEYLFTVIFLIIGFNRLIAALKVGDTADRTPRQSARARQSRQRTK